MNTMLLSDLVTIMKDSNAGFLQFELNNATIIVAEREVANAMIDAYEGMKEEH